MDEVGLVARKNLVDGVPLLHDKLMGNLQLRQY